VLASPKVARSSLQASSLSQRLISSMTTTTTIRMTTPG
jgi:hypothetical protein